MSAIRLNLSKTENDLFCKSKWWGNPDVPDGFCFDDSLMFLCQIRCEDLSTFGKEEFPEQGMLYFFCDLAYFLGYYDEFDPPSGPLWDDDRVKVYYVETVDENSFKQLIFDDDYFPQIRERKIDFKLVEDFADGHKLLGTPSCFEYEDWDYPCEGWINLLQVDSDEDEDYNLLFMDMGLLYLIINPEDLRKHDYTKVRAYIYST